MDEFLRQLESWIKSAKADLDTASLLISEAKLGEGLFFCHLAIEKGLKAHMVKYTREYPPELRDLKALLKLAHIQVSKGDDELLEVLENCRLEIRLPYDENNTPTAVQTFEYLNRTRELLKWLEITL